MSPSGPVEIEAKYRIKDASLGPRLLRRKTLSSRFRLGPSTEAKIVDVYVDTKDAKLLRAGYSLRMRSKGDRQLVTLKGLHNMSTDGEGTESATQHRYELECPLPSANSTQRGERLKVSRLPDDIRAAIEGITSKKPKLFPFCTVNQTRHQRAITPSRAVTETSEPSSVDGIATLSIDEVTIFEGAIGNVDEVNPIDTFTELEAELLPGHAAEELEPIAEILAGLEGLAPEGDSKFLRALTSVSRAGSSAAVEGESTPPGRIRTTTATAEALRHVWREQFVQILILERGVRRDDDIEHIHNMRVAIRRMRAAHVLLGHFFRVGVIDPLVSGLKRTARLLGKVRDLDVAVAKLQSHAERLDSEGQRELQPLFTHWHRERTKRYRELLKWLDSERYSSLLGALRAFVETPDFGVKKRFEKLRQPPEAHQIRHVLPAVLLDRFLAVRKYETLFAARAASAELDQKLNIEVETLHALRIECKYLRYTLEFTPALLGKEGQELIKQLKKLQDLLGDLNDASVTKEMLAKLPGEVLSKPVNRYSKRQNKVIRKCETRASSALQEFLGAENRASLGVMLGQI